MTEKSIDGHEAFKTATDKVNDAHGNFWKGDITKVLTYNIKFLQLILNNFFSIIAYEKCIINQNNHICLLCVGRPNNCL